MYCLGFEDIYYVMECCEFVWKFVYERLSWIMLWWIDWIYNKIMVLVDRFYFN